MKAIQIFLAIVLPPAGVFLTKGISTAFWLSLALTLAFFIPGLAYSLMVVLRH